MIQKKALLKTGDSTFDKIYAYYVDSSKFNLSPKQHEIRERWLSAFTLRLQFHSREQAAGVLKDKYGIERAQAYRDLKNAERLFGNVLKVDREGTLAILYEYSHKYFQMAIKAKDLKAMGKALDLMGKYADVDNDTSINFNPEKLEYKPIKISVPKLVIERILAQGQTGVHDFNKVVDAEAIVIEDEEE